MSTKGGLEYIQQHQQAGGGFQSYRLDEPKVKRAKSYQTTFVPSLIALALDDVGGSEPIKDKIATFLMAQKSPAWSWNYWDRSSPLMSTLPYPDDLDDTFLALSALMQHDPKQLDPTAMAEIANLLFATESKTGGPYRTWLVDKTPDDVWRDVDLVVNINIGYFLSLQDVSLPHVDALVAKAIKQGKIESPYYPPLLPAVYFLARWYNGDQLDKLCQLVLGRQILGAWESPHVAALAISSLLRLGYSADKLEADVRYVRESQASNGSWPAGPTCVDTIRSNETKKYFTGAATLTTALCLEALNLYDQALAPKQTKQSPRPLEREYKAVVDEVKNSINNLAEPNLIANTNEVLEKILARDTDKQIVILPWVVQGAAGVKTNEKTLHNLAIASLWGWMAYTVYDDFLDDEGDPKQLPSAIVANRSLLVTLRATLADNAAFHGEIAMIMNRLDGANAWEVNHCRGRIEDGRLYIDTLPDYGDYSQLADRSLGHTIAGLGVLYAAGDVSDAPRMVALRTFFRHYLIARQLNDDAHDFEQDLMLGHVNAVAVFVLQKWMTKHALKSGIHLHKDMKALRLIMWEDVIDVVCGTIQDHLDAAHDILNDPAVGLDQKYLQPLLTPLEEATAKALAGRDEAQKFISSLSS